MFHGIFKIMMKRLEKRKKVESQNMSFHSSKLPKNGFDTACKVIFQTSSGCLADPLGYPGAQNILNNSIYI
jgi:transcription initiation factor IIE alpha subunit